MLKLNSKKAIERCFSKCKSMWSLLLFWSRTVSFAQVSIPGFAILLSIKVLEINKF